MKRAAQSVVEIAFASDPGQVREANEDSYMVVADPDPALLARRGRLMLVADGMGGAVGGERASSEVARTVTDAYFGDLEVSIPDALGAALHRANDDVHRMAHEDPDLRGMGSTCTVAVIHDGHAWIGHVGDTRCYRVRRGGIEQLTHDHSVIAQMLRDNLISPTEAETHPKRNVILRSIGPKPTVEVDVLGPLPLEPGDRLVLCSDGLTGHVRDAEIAELVDRLPPGKAVEELVALANARGGEDNITVLVGSVAGGGGAVTQREPFGAEAGREMKIFDVAAPDELPSGGRRVRWALAGVLLMAVGLGVALALGVLDRGAAAAAAEPDGSVLEGRLDQGAPTAVAPAEGAGVGDARVDGAAALDASAAPDASDVAPPKIERVLSGVEAFKAATQLQQLRRACPNLIPSVVEKVGLGPPPPGEDDAQYWVDLAQAIAGWQRKAGAGKGQVDGIPGEVTQKKMFGEARCPQKPAKR